jgi:hypothetical protein
MAQAAAEEDLAAAEVQRLSRLMEEAAVSERQAAAEGQPFLGEEEVQRQKPGRS